MPAGAGAMTAAVADGRVALGTSFSVVNDGDLKMLGVMGADAATVIAGGSAMTASLEGAGPMLTRSGLVESGERVTVRAG